MLLVDPIVSLATTENVKGVTSFKRILKMYSPSCEPFNIMISGNIPESLVIVTLNVSPGSVTFTEYVDVLFISI